MPITHATVATLPDDPNAQVGTDEWNAAHVGSNNVNLFVATCEPEAAVSANLAVLANTAYLMKFSVGVDVTVTQISIITGTSSGNIDVGIYSVTGTLLRSSGTTVCPSANVRQAIALTASYALVAGTAYYMAVAFDNAVATLLGRTPAYNGLVMMSTGYRTCVKFAASFVLPGSLAIASGTQPDYFYYLEAS